MLVKIGMWGWGFVTVIVAVVSLGFVIVCGTYIDRDGHFLSNAPPFMPGMYIAVKDNSGLIAGVFAFSALAWSHFFDSGDVSRRRGRRTDE